MKLLSPEQYAKRRGVSKKAVDKAIKTGRIKATKSAGPGRGRGKKINPISADKQWDDNTDPAFQRKPPPNSSTEVAVYSRARAMEKTFQAKLTQLEFEQKTGKLISVDKVKIANYNIARVIQQVMLNIPARISAILAAETDEKRVFDILNTELRVALKELADGKWAIE